MFSEIEHIQQAVNIADCNRHLEVMTLGRLLNLFYAASEEGGAPPSLLTRALSTPLLSLLSPSTGPTGYWAQPSAPLVSHGMRLVPVSTRRRRLWAQFLDLFCAANKDGSALWNAPAAAHIGPAARIRKVGGICLHMPEHQCACEAEKPEASHTHMPTIMCARERLVRSTLGINLGCTGDTSRDSVSVLTAHNSDSHFNAFRQPRSGLVKLVGPACTLERAQGLT